MNEAAALDEGQRQTARSALYSDLTAEDLSEYSEALAHKKEDDLRAYRAKNGIPEEDATPEETRKCTLKRIMLCFGFENEKQAETVLKLNEAVEAVDTTVDLTSRVRPGAVHDYGKYAPLRRSVLFPGTERGPTRCEVALSPSLKMDRDCDQIRLIIRRFCLEVRNLSYPRDGKFHINNIRSALGITRQSLTAFLNKKGPENGVKSQAYELAWEFFKRRGMLDYASWDGEVVESRFGEENSSVSGDDEASEEVDVVEASGADVRTSKRQNEEADPGEERGKRTRTTTMPCRRSERLKR